MTNRSNLSFWEFTKRSARHATFEFFRPLVPPEAFGGNDFRRSLKAVSKAPEPAISSDGAQVVGFARDAEPHVNDYVDRSREVVDRGRAQWEEFVERGKNLAAEQSLRVADAIEAGKRAYMETSEEWREKR